MDDVRATLEPLWTAKRSVADKLCARIKVVFEYAKARSLATGNPVDGVRTLLPKAKVAVRNHASIAHEALGAVLRAIFDGGASASAKAALHFAALTACRSGEARGATWEEMDADAATWTIPAERTKGAKEHRIPLSRAALAVLRDVRPLEDGSGLMFPSPQRSGKAMSDSTLTQVLRDCGLADRATVHGFRTSFRMWASERTNAEHAVMELSLSHTVGSAVEQAYARSDLFDKRRRLMDRWAAYLGGGCNAKVVRLHG